MIYLLFILGFVLLIQGANWLVNGASRLAGIWGVSDLIVGLTIVSLGTSMPELLVSILASFSGSSGLATGNILGSNIANVLLILGITAIVSDLPVKRNTVLSEVPFSLAAALLVGFLANSALWYEKADELEISRGDGLIILFFFFLFMAYVFDVARDKDKNEHNSEKDVSNLPVYRNWLYILIGIIALFLGGKWVVEGAVHLGKVFGLSEVFIGLTVVAVGTSLPELVTSIFAALKKNTDIAVGNVVGSNIFNLLWILGLSATIRPLPFNVASNVDLLMVIGSSSLILLALIIGRRMVIKRFTGIVFLIIYALYIYFISARG